jgi:hypothetical protein
MTELLEHELGLTWVLDERMHRSAHALVDEGRVWIVDPTDDAAALERAAALGTPQAVVQLLDRHNRACAKVAAQLAVPHLPPGAPIRDAPFEVRPVLRQRFWREVALWWPGREGLVVAEAVGTAPAFAVGDGPVGVHPMLRLTPPGALRGLRPQHLLVGHGPPVHGADAADGLPRALARSRQDLPRLALALPKLVRG